MRFFCFVFCTFYQYVAFSQDIKPMLVRAYQSEDSSNYYFDIARKSIKSKEDWSEYYFCKNAFYSDRNQYDSAIFYGKKAIKLYKESKNNQAIFTVYNNLNSVYAQQGLYDTAIHYSLQGLKDAENLKDTSWIAFFTTRLSLNYHDYELYDKGIYFGKKALNLHLKKAKQDRDGIYDAINAIAINYDDSKKLDSAIYYHQMVFKYYKNSDTLKIGATYNNIANTLLKQKKFKQAKKWLERALKIVQENEQNQPWLKDSKNYRYRRATIFTNMAIIESSLGNYSQAETYFKQAAFYALKSQSAEKLRDLYAARAAFFAKTERYKEAVLDHEKYIQLRDSVFDVKRARTFSELEAKYQHEVKEKELVRAKSEIEIRELKLKRKNTQALVLFVLTIVIGILSYVIYRNQRLKNKQQQQAFELQSALAKIEVQKSLQDQRLQISRDLHDNIGSQLTFIISSIDNIRYGFSKENSKLIGKLNVISEFAKSTITELRDTIWAMNKEEVLFEDLKIRISNFIDNAHLASNIISFDFTCEDKLYTTKLSSQQGINCYRIIQEAVNNAIKHASPKNISVQISTIGNMICIKILDDGVGFDSSVSAMGYGLKNLEKRANELNGKLNISTNFEHKGTIVEVQFIK